MSCNTPTHGIAAYVEGPRFRRGGGGLVSCSSRVPGDQVEVFGPWPGSMWPYLTR